MDTSYRDETPENRFSTSKGGKGVLDRFFSESCLFSGVSSL